MERTTREQIGSNASLIDDVCANTPIGYPSWLLEVVLYLGEARVDKVLDVVVHRDKREPITRPVSDHSKGRAAVDCIATCQCRGHRNEVFRVPVFYVPSIPCRIVVFSLVVRKRDDGGCFKRVWQHSV